MEIEENMVHSCYEDMSYAIEYSTNNSTNNPVTKNLEENQHYEDISKGLFYTGVILTVLSIVLGIAKHYSLEEVECYDASYVEITKDGVNPSTYTYGPLIKTMIMEPTAITPYLTSGAIISIISASILFILSYYYYCKSKECLKQT